MSIYQRVVAWTVPTAERRSATTEDSAAADAFLHPVSVPHIPARAHGDGPLRPGSQRQPLDHRLR